MDTLYQVLRQKVGLPPLAALHWIYGPKDLPSSRIPSHFMDERRRRLGRPS